MLAKEYRELIIRLSQARNKKAKITIKYHGGSQPGTVREIAPVRFYENKVQAKCYLSNKLKHFKYDKIEIVEKTTTQDVVWNPDKNLHEIFTDLKDLYEQKKGELSLYGFYVHFENDELSLHEYFKNGKPKTGALVRLLFDEYENIYDYDFDSEGDELNEILVGRKKKAMPWLVYSPNKPTRSYIYFDKAATYFLEQARLNAKNDI